jgi:hypothetical protein
LKHFTRANITSAQQLFGHRHDLVALKAEMALQYLESYPSIEPCTTPMESVRIVLIES